MSPAFTKILPWYSNYIIPPTRKRTAIARTKYLGVKTLDLDSIDEYANGDVNPSTSPASTLKGPTNPEEMIKKQKSAKWLRTQKHSDTFRLYELTKAFFGPLEQLLGEKEYLLSDDGPTSVDCVAVGYLSLMVYAQVPQSWLAEAFKSRFPKLHAYTIRMYQDTFEKADIPWRSRLSKAPYPDAAYAARIMGNGLLDLALPSMRQKIHLDPIMPHEQSVSRSPSLLSNLFSPAVLLPIGAIAGLAFAIMKYTSISSDYNSNHFRAHEHDYLEPTSLSDLGESGAILAALGQQRQLETQYEREKERVGGATVVEVDVENERGEVGRDVIMKK